MPVKLVLVGSRTLGYGNILGRPLIASWASQVQRGFRADLTAGRALSGCDIQASTGMLLSDRRTRRVGPSLDLEGKVCRITTIVIDSFE